MFTCTYLQVCLCVCVHPIMCTCVWMSEWVCKTFGKYLCVCACMWLFVSVCKSIREVSVCQFNCVCALACLKKVSLLNPVKYLSKEFGIFYLSNCIHVCLCVFCEILWLCKILGFLRVFICVCIFIFAFAWVYV